MMKKALFVGLLVEALAGSCFAGELPSPFFRGMEVTGTQELNTVPKGAALPTLSSTWATATINGTTQAYPFGWECVNQGATPAPGGNVCHYQAMEATATGGNSWVTNPVMIMDAGFSHSNTAIANETDINNLAGDHIGFDGGGSTGILLNGLRFMNSAGISIQTGNSVGGVTGTSGRLPIWYYGLFAQINSVYYATFDDESDANYSLKVDGHHAVGLDLSGGAFAADAIFLSAGTTQGIGANSSTGTGYTLLYADVNGSAHLGSVSNTNSYVDNNLTINSASGGGTNIPSDSMYWMYFDSSGAPQKFQIGVAANQTFVFQSSSGKAPLAINGPLLTGGSPTAIATTATDPFLYVSAMAGMPTGTPHEAALGYTAIVNDSADNKLCWYQQSSSSWKCVTGS
jgi:hypothetical protein